MPLNTAPTQPINAKIHEGEPILYINWSFSGLPFLCRWLTPRRVFCSVVVLCDVQTLPSKTTQKMFSITKLMTAQIFYKTTTGELFRLPFLGWLHTDDFWFYLYNTLWLLHFNNHTIFYCHFELCRRRKNCGRCFNLYLNKKLCK